MYAVSSRFTQQGIQARSAETATARRALIAQERSRQAEERASRETEARRQEEAELARLEEMASRRKKAVEELTEANRVLARLRGGSAAISMMRIVNRICRALEISREELLSNRRSRRIVFARQAIMYWTCRRTKLSLPEIGRRLGGKDHTTCLHGRDAYPEKRAKMGRYLRPVR